MRNRIRWGIATAVLAASLFTLHTWHLVSNRIAMWDAIHLAKGTISLNQSPWCIDFLSERGAFGWALGSVTYVAVDGYAGGDQFLAALGNLEDLRELKMTSSNITNVGFANFTNAPRLKTVCLGSNPIGDEGVHSLLKMAPGIVDLHLEFTSITDAIGNDLMSMKELKDIGLTGTATSNAAFANASWVGPLWRMNIGDTRVSGDESLNLPRSLVGLTLSNNGNISAIVDSLDGMTDLRFLNLDGCAFPKANQKWIAHLTRLRTLLIRKVPLHDELLHEISLLPQLSHLDISQCTLNQNGWSSLESSTSLKLLECRDCDLRHLKIGAEGCRMQLDCIDLTGAQILDDQIDSLHESGAAKRVYTGLGN